MSNQEPPSDPTAKIDTGGGAHVEGDVYADEFVGRDKVIYLGEQQYDVHGLRNPYLGLRSFTYNERERYAGRELLVEETRAKLTEAGGERTLFFVKGTSGSGKSSFAQAGLLPELERYYGRRGNIVKAAVFTPSLRPLDALRNTLAELGLPISVLANPALTMTPQAFCSFTQTHTPPQQINVVIIDQFEELLTQSQPLQRDALLQILEELPTFAQLRTHIIVTIRSDYVADLAHYPRLYATASGATSSTMLRAMTQEELEAAIVHPLHAFGFSGTKRFEPALLEQLARDTAQEAGYLPLLQVTLQDLWARGLLKLSEYGSLTDAIEKRAELAYGYSTGGKPRSETEQAIITDILLNLLEVSLDDAVRRDVRRRRTYAELTSGMSTREQLIEDFRSARLLVVTDEVRGAERVRVVNIIHESLIDTWTRLRTAVAARRPELQERVRFEQRLQDWLVHDRASDYLLSGVWLDHAQQLDPQRHSVLHTSDAQDFLRASRRQTRIQRLTRGLSIIGPVLLLLLLAAGTLVYRDRAGKQARADARATVAAEATQVAIEGRDVEIGHSNPQEQEQSRRSITLLPFKIDKYEVRYRHYHSCILHGPCAEDSPVQGAWSRPEFADYPVVDISPRQAERFCGWLERRLPTSVEWESAARLLAPNTQPGEWDEDWQTAYLQRKIQDPDFQRIQTDPGYRELGTVPVDQVASSATPPPTAIYHLADNVSEFVTLAPTNCRGQSCQQIPQPASYAEMGGSIAGFREYASQIIQVGPDEANSSAGFRCLEAQGGDGQ